MDQTKTMGRPSKGESKRSHRVAVYLNSDELALVNREAEISGLTLAVLIRMRALESIRRSNSTDVPL